MTKEQDALLCERNANACESEPQMKEHAQVWRERAAELRASGPDDARDAARYRWLRREDNDACVVMPAPPDDSWVPHTEELDAAIDAEMAKEPSNG